MSSPAPAPPMRPRYPRSFAGPVVLITMGVVFLMATMGVLHFRNLGVFFAHYWPLLLILWGVIKLLEHQQALRLGTRASGIGAGGVFLIIVIIVFGLMATQLDSVDWDALRDQIHVDDDQDFPFFGGHTYNYEDQLSLAFPENGNLHIVNDRGAVNVSASEDNYVHVAVHKRIRADRQGDADKWNGSTKPQLTASGLLMTLSANNHGGGEHPVASDLDVTLPRQASVVISSHRGDVSVLGRNGEVEISSQKGEVSVSDIRGKVSLNLAGSSARVSQVASDVFLQGRADDISLEDIKGSVHLDGEFMESVKLAKISKGVSFKSSRTDMELARLDGSLDLDSGDLRASNVAGPVKVLTRSKDIEFNGVSGDVRIQDENGPVELHMSKLGNVQVDNRSADVTIHLPDKAGFQLDARARNGEIATDFSSLKVDKSDDSSTAKGIVGGGGVRLVINNEHGSIEIRRGTELAEGPAPPAAPKPPDPPQPPGVTEN
jgi:DUF4097 and DUF4098 domain-containing protein YvlB